jgi:hypothetical protein
MEDLVGFKGQDELTRGGMEELIGLNCWPDCFHDNHCRWHLLEPGWRISLFLKGPVRLDVGPAGQKNYKTFMITVLNIADKLSFSRRSKRLSGLFLTLHPLEYLGVKSEYQDWIKLYVQYLAVRNRHGKWRHSQQRTVSVSFGAYLFSNNYTTV